MKTSSASGEAALGRRERGGVRVVIVEDNAYLREAVAAGLALDPGIEVLGSVASVSEGEALLARTRELDVALIDLGLPDGSGLLLIESLTARRPDVAAVAFTVFDDERTVLAAIAAGARGYLLKDTSVETLRARVHEAASGGAPLSPEAARFLVDAMRSRSADGFDGLTQREREVASLLAEGMTYADAAAALEVRLGTVQTHVKAIYGKLGVSTKTELSARAFGRRG